MHLPAQPRCQEVLLARGERDEDVAVEAEPDVGGIHLGIAGELSQIVDPVGIQPRCEADVQVAHQTDHGAFRDVARPQRRIDIADCGHQLIEGSAALLRRGHAQTLIARRSGRCVGYRRSVSEVPANALDAPADHASDGSSDGAAGDAGPVADEPTGVASVDAARARLRDLAAAPIEEHVEIFDDVQRQLHDALAELDDGQ